MTPEEWNDLQQRIEAWDAWRKKKAAEDAVKNCRHPNKHSQGAMGSDGSSRGSWYCPDCQQRGEWTTPPALSTAAGWPYR